MSRPQIIVNVTEALPRRGTTTATGTAFMVYAGAAGPAVPTVCTSAADATAAAVPAPFAAFVGAALEQGAPSVVIVRAQAADATAVTEAEWATGLAKLTKDFGVGQVLIPGVTTDAAYSALLAHAAAFPTRTVLLDTDPEPVVATLAASAAALADADGSQRATFVGPSVKLFGDTTFTPASVLVAGLVARGDAAARHANNAPIFDQGRSAGVVRRGASVSDTFTDADADTLFDAGVNLIRIVGGLATLTGWHAISTDPQFKQLNVGRLSAQVDNGVEGIMYPFLGRQIDGQGHLFVEVEGALRGYFLDLYNANALYGATAADAFDVVCNASNNPLASVQAGHLVADMALSASPHTEQITGNVVMALAQEVSA